MEAVANQRAIGAALTIVVCGVSVPWIANFFWYRASRPEALRDAAWSGTWSSDGHPALGGRLLVDLPYPVPDGEVRAAAWVYYDLWSPYRGGESSELELSGSVAAGSGAAVRDGVELSLAGKLPGGLVVVYEASEIDGRLVGTYETIPADRGSFILGR